MAGLKLRFEPTPRVVAIESEGEVAFEDLYAAIREWEASSDGIVFDEVLQGSGNVPLPDGTRTPRVMIFVNGWRLSATQQVRIVGGIVTARNGDGTADHPVEASSRDRVHIHSSEGGQFIPTEAQVLDARARAALFREDWDIDTDKRHVRRKETAKKRSHTVLGLYWFLKEAWLRSSALMAFPFPIKGDGLSPATSTERRYELEANWGIPEADRAFLTGGPLIRGGEVVVPADGSGAANSRQSAPPAITLPAAAEGVRIGVIVALPKEYAAMKRQLDNQVKYVGRKGAAYLIGELPASGGGKNTVALIRTGDMGNNSAAIAATDMCWDFPNLRAVLMVGIAGAAPCPSDVTVHVRLGDVVALGEGGVVQYDLDKETLSGTEVRARPRPPSSLLLDAAKRLECGRLEGKKPWMDLLARTAGLEDCERPSAVADVLMDGDTPVTHPLDRDRMESEPRIFLGVVASANKLLKNPKKRDELRDRFKARAVEMEGSGVADAAHARNIQLYIVRGTCDYCDEHKDDVWQGYAAVVAAAYAAALLRALAQLP